MTESKEKLGLRLRVYFDWIGGDDDVILLHEFLEKGGKFEKDSQAQLTTLCQELRRPIINSQQVRVYLFCVLQSFEFQMSMPLA